MRLWISAVALPFLLVGCSRSEEPAPSPPPAATAHVSAAATARPPAAPVVDDEIEDEEDDDSKPSGPEFEIDANASTYFGYIPKTIAFQAGALNGTPPFTYTWDFGDGTDPAHGPYVVHVFKKDGRSDVFVTGKDANGETSRVQLAIVLLTPEEFARRKGLDPRTLPSETPRDYQTPTPEAPVATPGSTK